LKKLLQILLLPFSLLYGVVIYLRNKCYDWGVFSSVEFKTTIISVGNLAIGGVGKTPHVAYLIELLQPNYKVATLSRGYKRVTSGFILSDENSTAEDIGDEPLLYKNRFNTMPVAVDEKRVNGVQELTKTYPNLDVILLDDAYQHRAIKPHINILITEFGNLYTTDYLLPSGRLREGVCGNNRADIIIVSKCPTILSPIDKKRVLNELASKKNKPIYFSYIKYKNIIPYSALAKEFQPDFNSSILLLTGIANPLPLYYELKNSYKFVQHISFNDHHTFTDEDISKIKTVFNKIIGNNKLIITTEKDIMRLSLPKINEQIKELPVYYIPIEIDFHGEDKQEFDNKILNYVKENRRN